MGLLRGLQSDLNFFSYLYFVLTPHSTLSWLSFNFIKIQKTNYFQIGEESPRKFEYGALKDLMHDNNDALALLKKGRQRMRVKNTVLIVGATTFVIGVVSTIIRHSKGTTSLDEYTISPLGLIGGVVVGISLLMPNETRDYKKAIVLYNK